MSTASLGQDDFTEVERGFYRGEFDSPFETNDSSIHSHGDHIIQQTLGIGPTVLEQFLRRVKEPELKATHFAKLFANLRLDWPKKHFDPLYYFLEPYKYGPLPIVPQKIDDGGLLRLERFLVNYDCILEFKEPHGTQMRRAFRPNPNSTFPWRRIYKNKLDGSTKAHISGLVRLYGRIQQKCKTRRPAGTGKTVYSLFADPLVVLASVRNKLIAYTCGWFEVDDWQQKGDDLFIRLTGCAVNEQHYARPVLTEFAKSFAEPAVLLSVKIEMYKNLPYLRKQIEELRDSGEFEATYVLLEKVDKEPQIETESEYPIGNLVWACAIMRSFSSFTRQVLTCCGLDIDKRLNSNRVDEKGRPKDASYYLESLLKSAQELKPLEVDLSNCVEAAKEGILTQEIANQLSKAFRVILKVFEAGNRIPRPKMSYADNYKIQRNADLFTRLREIAIPEPYAVAVGDIKNFVNIFKHLSRYSEDPDEALDFLLKTVRKCAEKATNAYPNVHFSGPSVDNLIFASHDPDNLYLSILDLTRRTVSTIEHEIKDLREFGLFRTGIAWQQRNLGIEYSGVHPGITALKIGDKTGRPWGSITITKAVYNRLSPEHRRQFSQLEGEDCDQGEVFIRLWNTNIDLVQ